MPVEAVGITTIIPDELSARATRAVAAFRAVTERIRIFPEGLILPENEVRPCETQIGILPESLWRFYSAVRYFDPYKEDAVGISPEDRQLYRSLAERIESLKWPGILLRNVQEPDEDCLLRHRIAQMIFRALLEETYSEWANYPILIRRDWIVVRGGSIHAPYCK